MKNIFIIGAGRSAFALIKYLLMSSEEHDWNVTVGDMNLELAEERVDNHPNARAIKFNVFDEAQLNEEVAKVDLVISMLPARFHPIVAKVCLKNSCSLFTASYVSEELRAMEKEVEEKGILFLNEIGLDPGIDHLSAMEIIDKIKEKGGELTLFKSFTGGLVAPESDNNPWNYKFTWNPRNVVLAGQGTAKYIRNGQYKYTPYHNLFYRLETIKIDGYGEFEGYANRDSLVYREVYGLDEIPTMVRGTIRKKGFCKAWNVFVQLGMTDDTYQLENSQYMTYREFINTFIPYDKDIYVEEKVCRLMKWDVDGEEINKLKWLGIFEDVEIGLENATPAQILQQLLEEKWTLEEEDKDMIVMQHKFEYDLDGESHLLTSSLVVLGDDAEQTAMAKTVGLPLAIAAKLFLTGKINLKGVQVPVQKEIYQPVLEELTTVGVKFFEEHQVLAH